MTSGSMAYPAVQTKRDSSMPLKREGPEDVYGCVLQDPRAMVIARLPEPQPPAMQAYIPRRQRLLRGHPDRVSRSSALEPSAGWAVRNDRTQGGEHGTYGALVTSIIVGRRDGPPGREPQGHGATILLSGRESRPHGEGWQVL